MKKRTGKDLKPRKQQPIKDLTLEKSKDAKDVKGGFCAAGTHIPELTLSTYRSTTTSP